MLAASVAAGVSSTFAATLGGVLFSIEITTINYDLGNYFKAFVAAISGTVAVSLVRTLAEGSPVRALEDTTKGFAKKCEDSRQHRLVPDLPVLDPVGLEVKIRAPFSVILEAIVRRFDSSPR